MDIIAIEKDVAMVEWVDLGEGYSGDYDEDDPDDENLLRFDVYRWKDGEWIEVDDGSYCTLTPADTPEDILQKLADLILEHVVDNIDRPLKKLLEHLSWIHPEWLN